jgi:dihydrofolate synthase / folylpolyglutamate synthase
MTYQHAIDYLMSTLPMFSRIGKAAYKKDLTNTIELCNFLNSPQHAFKSVHIAGTNGKGSTSHMLASVFQSAGYKTGLYTSPHLKDFRERIRINGEMVQEEFVAEFVLQIQPLIEKIEPSFFETTVAMAFEYFRKEKVDIAIIETGLGGRLDSTNVIQPELSVITNIGWDHMNILGDSLEKIAIEKAGIIKKDTPVVIGEADGSIKSIFEEQAKELNAPIVFASELYHAIDWQYKHHDLVVEIGTDNSTEKKFYHLDLPGLYQTKNLVTTLAAIHELEQKGFVFYDSQIKNGLRNTKRQTGLHGRWEVINEHPAVILDVAHNADGIKQLLRQLELIEPKHLHIVIGLVRDKEINQVLALLPKHAQYYFTQAQIPRALPVNSLMEAATEYDLKGESFAEVNAALKQALSKAAKDDLILVCGSVFVVGEVAFNRQ